MFEWAYSGANKAVPRNVGPECAFYLSHQRQIIETVLVTAICIYILVSILNEVNLISCCKTNLTMYRNM